jgi:hypothetical protein
MPTRNAGLGAMWTETATVDTPIQGQDATGAATFQSNLTTNVPCSIQPVSGSAVTKYGGGHVVDSTVTHQGYFPAILEDGTILAMRSRSTATVGGVVYEATGPGTEYATGIQVVPMKVKK